MSIVTGLRTAVDHLVQVCCSTLTTVKYLSNDLEVVKVNLGTLNYNDSEVIFHLCSHKLSFVA